MDNHNMSTEQEPIEKVDISFVLKTVMAANDLSVSEIAKLAGVSKSTMEKYLSGPSSPRAVALASLSNSLGIAVDTLLFGELDGQTEAAHQLAFRAFVKLLKDLKTEPDLRVQFSDLEAGTEEFEEFVRNTAFMCASKFKYALRDEQFSNRKTTTAS
jgi:transcriptional regulator with XRE-family HTH domain